MLSRVVAVVSVLLLGIAIGGAGIMSLNRLGSSEPVLINTAVPAPTSAPVATETSLQVYVNGAVARPDVYVLPQGSRIKQAILAAGGFTADADTVQINLAQQLSDGMYIYVSVLGETPPPQIVIPEGGGSASRSQSMEVGSELVNINTATQKELETLPGIGPSIAQKILDYRQANGPFPTIESILDVPGIGEVKFQQIRELISASN
jgi:competence protein ComEA